MLNFKKMLVIDIETVAQHHYFETLNEIGKTLWMHKANQLHRGDSDTIDYAYLYETKAGIYAEFGKIICIGLGFTEFIDGNVQVRMKHISHHDEHFLLQEFVRLITKQEQHGNVQFCGHNIKEFDLPYICRRLIINEIPIPVSLQLSGIKPWQNPHTDTLELWRFGDYKHYISLNLLAHILGVPSSKTDIDGSEVGRVYYQDNDLERIANYCLQDIYTTALVYLRLMNVAYREVIPIFVAPKQD